MYYGEPLRTYEELKRDIESYIHYYNNEFKRIFITENEFGKFPREIFEDAGFDIEMMGMKRVHKAAVRWKSAYKKQGITGLEDSQKYSSGRPLERDLR